MKPKLSSEKIVSYSAIFISFITLIIFIYQTNLTRKQNYLSILPYLSLSTTNNSEGGFFKVDLNNVGIGPAIIISRKIIYKGEEYDMDFIDFLEEQQIKLDSFQHTNTTTIGRGTCIPANGQVTLFEIGRSKKELNQFLLILEDLQDNGFDFEIIYQSIYQEKWRITTTSDLPEKVP